jgi:hypothetical protein
MIVILTVGGAAWSERQQNTRRRREAETDLASAMKFGIFREYLRTDGHEGER